MAERSSWTHGWLVWATLTLGLSAAAACARNSPEGVSTVEAGDSRSPPRPNASAAPSSATAKVQPPGSQESDWREAIRFERWAKAAELMDALPKTAEEDAGFRYARARVAAALGDHERAVKLLTGLEKKLSLLAAEIARDRAASQLEAGPFEQAALFYAQRGTVQDSTRAALAFERASKPTKAKAAADKAISRASRLRRKKRLKSPNLEASARLVRARVLDTLGKRKLAAADRSWILTQAPTSDAGKQLGKSPGAEIPSLSSSARYERAMSMARDGDVAGTDAELALLPDAKGPKIPAAEQTHARGWARYMARKYSEAAKLLQQAAQQGSKHRIRDTYYAAKALSRSHADARAIKMYDGLAARHPGSSFAERSRYTAARLRYIMGDWKGADAAYGRYLKRHKKRGEFLDSVAYERAITRLAAGKYKSAAKDLAALAKSKKRGRERARLLELEGVAHLGLGKKKRAARRFRTVIKERPLSFAALTASTRLEALGEKLPPMIEPARVDASRPALEVGLPPKVRLLHELGLDLDAETELVQHEAAFRAKHGKRGDEALCEAYGKLAHAGRRYRVGQRAVSWQALAQAPSESTRWSWNCIYPRPYDPVVAKAGKQYEMAPELIYALMRQESGFRPAVVSSAKAVGLMQLIPPTARQVASELSVEYQPALLRSPTHNIAFGTFYLNKLLTTFKGSVALALAAYNAGPSAVSRWLESGENLPLDLFVARIPYHETRGYVGRVLGNLARYAYLKGGDSAVPKLELELPRGARASKDAY